MKSKHYGTPSLHKLFLVKPDDAASKAFVKIFIMQSM